MGTTPETERENNAKSAAACRSTHRLTTPTSRRMCIARPALHNVKTCNIANRSPTVLSDRHTHAARSAPRACFCSADVCIRSKKKKRSKGRNPKKKDQARKSTWCTVMHGSLVTAMGLPRQRCRRRAPTRRRAQQHARHSRGALLPRRKGKRAVATLLQTKKNLRSSLRSTAGVRAACCIAAGKEHEPERDRSAHRRLSFFQKKSGNKSTSLQKLVTGVDRSPTVFAGRRTYADGRRRSPYSRHHRYLSVVIRIRATCSPFFFKTRKPDRKTSPICFFFLSAVHDVRAVCIGPCFSECIASMQR